MLLPLANPDFLPEVLKTIHNARSSITLVNFLATFSPKGSKRDPVKEIAESLISAAKRGLDVRVFLEGSKFEENYPFYRLLKDGGVDAWMDTSKTFIHQKVLMADRKLIILGSHNLTAGSIFESEELSAITDSRSLISTFEKGLKKISSQKDEIKGKDKGEQVVLPRSLAEGVIAPLYRAHAGLAFDLYMILFLEDNGRPRAIPIDAERWGKMLGFDPGKASGKTSPRYRRYYFAQRLNRIFAQLKKHDLVKIDRVTDTVTRTFQNAPSKNSLALIKVPKAYWQNGWMRKLSFSAKYFYFISLIETLDSPFYPWWSLPTRQIGKKYACDAGSIRKGALELEKYGVMEILRGKPVKRGSSYTEEAQFYRLNPLSAVSKV